MYLDNQFTHSLDVTFYSFRIRKCFRHCHLMSWEQDCLPPTIFYLWNLICHARKAPIKTLSLISTWNYPIIYQMIILFHAFDLKVKKSKNHLWIICINWFVMLTFYWHDFLLVFLSLSSTMGVLMPSWRMQSCKVNLEFHICVLPLCMQVCPCIVNVYLCMIFGAVILKKTIETCTSKDI